MIFFFSLPLAKACDVCGCVASNAGNFSILPQFRENWTGISFARQVFKTRHPSSLIKPEEAVFSLETFVQLELSTRFFLSERWQVIAFVPYRHNQQTGLEAAPVRLQGIGDIRLLSYYMVIDQKESDNAFKINWMLGGGISLPTGSYTEEPGSVKPHIYLQPGTGAWSALVTSILTLRYQSWGTQVSASTAANTSNPEGFKPGNRFDARVAAFRLFPLKGLTIAPRLALFMEYAGTDRQGTESIELSGGEQWAINPGLDMYFNRLILTFDYRNPITQRYGNGRVTQQSSATMSILYTF